MYIYMDYKDKYLKYKNKYNNLKSLLGGDNCLKFGFQQHSGECWHDSLGMLLMQSDLTKDAFIRSMQSINIDEVQAKLVDLFSPKNLDKNAYLLPYTIYIYYLKNKTLSDINQKITDFLEYCKIYVTNHILRALNRITYDENMSRYPKDQYKYSVFGDMQQIQEDIIKVPDAAKKTALRRQGSVQATIMCTETLFTIYDLFTRTDDKFLSVTDTKKRGGTTTLEILAIEILNMYILRNIPENNNMYFNFYNNKYDDPIRPDGEANPIIKEYILSLQIKSDVPEYIIDNIKKECYSKQKELLSSENLIGVNVSGHINDELSNGHAICFYKCDLQEFIYDNNVTKGPLKCTWGLELMTFLNAKIDKTEDYYLIYYDSQYKLEKYRLKLLSEEENTDVRDNERNNYYMFIDTKIFIEKNKFKDGDSKTQEINYILNKCNFFTEDNEIKILYKRLFELIGITIHNINTKKQEFLDIVSTNESIFNMYNFMTYGVNILVEISIPDIEQQRTKNKTMIKAIVSKMKTTFEELFNTNKTITDKYQKILKDPGKLILKDPGEIILNDPGKIIFKDPGIVYH